MLVWFSACLHMALSAGEHVALFCGACIEYEAPRPSSLACSNHLIVQLAKLYLCSVANCFIFSGKNCRRTVV